MGQSYYFHGLGLLDVCEVSADNDSVVDCERWKLILDQTKEVSQMDAIEAILSRRSIRKYTAEPVPKDLVDILLKAAMSAPSASNQQPWHFVVVGDRDILNKIPEFHPYSGMLKQAPLAIAVCADLQAELSKGMWIQDCAAATQNILLAAHANGLGAVWLGIYPREQRVVGLRQLLGLPEHIVPLSLVSIGYPAEKKLPVNRFDLARIHHNHW